MSQMIILVASIIAHGYFLQFFVVVNQSSMAENTEIDLNIRVIDSAININVTRKRSTDVIRNSILFQANAHLHNRLGAGSQASIRPSGLVGFEPPGESTPSSIDS